MIKNRTKKAFELTAAIIALVLCAIDLIVGINTIISLVKYYNYYSPEYIIGFILGFALVVAELILTILILINISSNNKKGIRVAFIVISSVLSFFLLVSVSTGDTSSIYFMILFVLVIIFESISLGMKETTTESQAQQKDSTSKTASSIDEKVIELKHLLELGVISQEQYEAAIEKTIKSII